LPVEATDLSQVVCYDYVDREPVRISEKGRTANDNIVILPNRQTVVRVIREVGADVTIGLGGTPGETKLKLDSEVVTATSTSSISPSITKYSTVKYTVFQARFVPRTPGFVPLTLTTNKPREQPAESKPQPAKSKPQPAESKPQPAESKPQPAESKPQPAESKPQPA
jgi:hypothetical protein